MAKILQLVIRPFLILLGTIGNGLSFYIMRQGSMKKMSTCFYLSILALADISKFYVTNKISKNAIKANLEQHKFVCHPVGRFSNSDWFVNSYPR